MLFAILLAEQIVFSLAPLRLAPYIMVTSVMALAYALIAYAVGKTLEKS